uniref:Nucleotidyl transferase domain-containing protein n=1 Tax=Salix viminalis TaxID=40686 RepID=A0A6N2LQK2_SALVM
MSNCCNRAAICLMHSIIELAPSLLRLFAKSVHIQFSATSTSHIIIPSSKSALFFFRFLPWFLPYVLPRFCKCLYVNNIRESIYGSVAAIVFGDGSESRLYPLTKRRSEGAIPIGANYRIVDAVISNCINSNINKMYALTSHMLAQASAKTGLLK